MRPVLEAVLARSPAQAVFHWRASRRLTVLGYHGIEDADRVAAHLDVVRRRAHPVSLEDVLDAVAGRRGLPRRAVLVTFDDGERTLVDPGVGLLQERGIPAVAFVVAGFVDSDELYWWSEVEHLVTSGAQSERFQFSHAAGAVKALKLVTDDERLSVIDDLRRSVPLAPRRGEHLRRDELAQLERAGVEIGNHSLTHPLLPQCDDDKIVREVVESHEILRAVLGHEPRAFAYPNGDCDARSVRAVQDAGYRVAFVFDHRVSPLVPPDPLRISRVRVNSTTAIDRLSTILSGLHPALHHARGRP